MIGTHTYQSKLARKMQEYLDGGHQVNIHHLMFDENNWMDIVLIPEDDRYALIHEAVSAGEQFNEFVTLLLFSFPYESMAHNEMTQAMHAVHAILSYESEGHYAMNRIDIARFLASDFMKEKESPAILTWSLSPSATETDRKLYKNAKAFQTSKTQLDFMGDRLTVRGEYHGEKRVVAFCESYVREAGYIEFARALYHELRHVHQRYNGTFHVEKQNVNGVFQRVNNLASDTGYFGLMKERQAFVFDCWIGEAINGRSLKSPDMTMMAEMQRQGTFCGDFMNHLSQFINFVAASQLRAGPSRVAGYLPDKTPQLVA